MSEKCAKHARLNIVTLENYDIQPVLLTKVRREKATH